MLESIRDVKSSARDGALLAAAGGTLMACIMRPSNPPLANAPTPRDAAPLCWGSDPLGDASGGPGAAARFQAIDLGDDSRVAAAAAAPKRRTFTFGGGGAPDEHGARGGGVDNDVPLLKGRVDALQAGLSRHLGRPQQPLPTQPPGDYDRGGPPLALTAGEASSSVALLTASASACETLAQPSALSLLSATIEPVPAHQVLAPNERHRALAAPAASAGDGRPDA